jgi:hypothetical protein
MYFEFIIPISNKNKIKILKNNNICYRKHPFLDANGRVNDRKMLNGEYEKIEEGRYSSTLVNLMERIYYGRSVNLKEGTSNRILEVFVLC